MLSVIPCGGEGWSWSVASSADCVGVGRADELSVVGGATEDLITGEYSIGETFPLQFVPNRRSRCFEVLHKLNQSHSFAAKVDLFRRLQIEKLKMVKFHFYNIIQKRPHFHFLKFNNCE